MSSADTSPYFRKQTHGPQSLGLGLTGWPLGPKICPSLSLSCSYGHTLPHRVKTCMLMGTRELTLTQWMLCSLNQRRRAWSPRFLTHIHHHGNPTRMTLLSYLTGEESGFKAETFPMSHVW